MTDTLPEIPNLSASTESPSRLMSVLRARCIARYRMRSISGRPEELEAVAFNPNAGYHLRISFGYSHGQVRVRQHGGADGNNREWVDYRDVQFKQGWLSEVYDYLDPFFGYTDPSKVVREISSALKHAGIEVGRPIRDNPQA